MRSSGEASTSGRGPAAILYEVEAAHKTRTPIVAVPANHGGAATLRSASPVGKGSENPIDRVSAPCGGRGCEDPQLTALPPMLVARSGSRLCLPSFLRM